MPFYGSFDKQLNYPGDLTKDLQEGQQLGMNEGNRLYAVAGSKAWWQTGDGAECFEDHHAVGETYCRVMTTVYLRYATPEDFKAWQKNPSLIQMNASLPI